MFEGLQGRVPDIMSGARTKKFAVMIPLIMKEDGYYVLFEKRSGSLRRQPGEICFPGGACEAGEQPQFSANRETCEELLVEPEQISIIAPMDILVTVYDNQVYSYLGEIKGYSGTFSTEEVEDVFLVPLSYFMENEPEAYINRVYTETEDNFPYDKIPGGRNYEWRSGKRYVFFYEYEGKVIWGMTAYILHEAVKLIKNAMDEGEKDGEEH